MININKWNKISDKTTCLKTDLNFSLQRKSKQWNSIGRPRIVPSLRMHSVSVECKRWVVMQSVKRDMHRGFGFRGYGVNGDSISTIAREAVKHGD